MAVAALAGSEPAVNVRHARIKVDGDLRDWKAVPFRTIIGGREPVAEVAVAHDATNLYLAYRVTSATPLLNRGQDPLHHFKEGAAMDLHVGPWRDEPTTPGAGDLRLLLVPTTPEPVAVLYRQVLPGAPAEEHVEFRSPVRTVTFDSVKPVPAVKVVFRKTATGYVCEAVVPLAVLGIESRPGLRLRGDVGVLLANDGGLLTAQRCNLFNRLATTVSDIPTEVELTPAGWGELVFE